MSAAEIFRPLLNSEHSSESVCSVHEEVTVNALLFPERMWATAPLLYFWSSKQNRAIWPKKIPCSSGISLLPQGIYLCYKPLFNCWNSPQVTVLRSVRNFGFRASMSHGKLRNFQILQSVSHGRIPITKRICHSQFRPKTGLWIRSVTLIRP